MEPWLVAYLLIAIWGALEMMQWRRGRRATASQAGNSVIALFCCYGVAILALMWPGPLPILIPLWMQWSGVAAGMAGLVLRAWCALITSKQAIGASTESQAAYVAERGPYRIIRYPHYLGNLTLWCGSAIASGNLSAFLTVAITMIGTYAIRISFEEARKSQLLGEEYAAYRKKSWRMFPLVY